ncbi:MAG: hypothetical protein NT178_07405 [Proteobacteria bacterium]|nr:hypothetical protein [Pseudomonadota bacterium]
MPLLFKSLNHGDVAFGFFNIETDMILLDNYFFFAADVSNYIVEITSRAPDESCIMEWDVYILEENRIGNLMGAITGVDLWGFIGEVYGHFPFPYKPEEFKQHPEGYTNRKLVEDIVKRYAPSTKIKVVTDLTVQTIKIGDYTFDKQGFKELLTYLWVGGYPQWMDGIRPDYIIRMKECIENSTYPLLGFKL